MATLAKLLPLIAMAGVGATQQDKIKETGSKIIDMVKVVATQHELTTIRTAVINENIAGNLNEVRRDFSGFVKQIAFSDSKDVSLDFWNKPYRFEEEGDMIYLISSGPDGREGTDDDIEVSLPKR